MGGRTAIDGELMAWSMLLYTATILSMVTGESSAMSSVMSWATKFGSFTVARHCSVPETTSVRAAIEDRGAETIVAPLATPGALDVTATLALLLDHRILTLLAEPGPRLAAALLDADLVDVVELHVAGAGDTAHVPGRVGPALPHLVPLLDDASGSTTVTRTRTHDGDLILRAERAHPASTLSEVA